MDYKALSFLSYGLYIVGSGDINRYSAYIANTVFQVTSQVPRLCISAHKNNATTAFIDEYGGFVVSVLEKNLDVKIISDFGFSSSKQFNKLENRKYFQGSINIPIIRDYCSAFFECTVKEKHDLSSHWLFIGELVNAGILSDKEVLTYSYYREHYKLFAPPNAPTYIDPEKLQEKSKEKDKSAEKEPIRFKCSVCGYIYDPEEGDPSLGIAKNTAFAELPEDYRCPVCQVTKEYFEEVS
jgi:flavin reductase (DIM6/NTAB) family NADH-FMN oxidoreductase RutF/rubredoxin